MFIAVVGKRGEGSRRRRLLEGADDGMKSSPPHRAGEAVAAGRERLGRVKRKVKSRCN